MPFGLKMSPDVFQMWMDQITDRLPAIIPIHYDICVCGRDTAEHKRNLLQLMQIATQQGLVFNSSMCAICQSQISFYGAIFTAQGMRPDPAKVQALQELPALKIHRNCSSFRLNQLLAIIPPQLCIQNYLLRKKVTNWDWNPLTDQAFHCMKSWICNMLLRATLAY